ncbi:hypothetical protein FKX85_15390 [Echinicola soli]|uniref:Uncharacterized protein n=1 Tax=Echinicola soli TaxID=2591634 RepID=A0A514CKH6_9BACT|nr:hypothetical protein [Echinicola soli]QDH80345.1 hypothetical protein FKX85_15390 [Echinicola soli]
MKNQQLFPSAIYENLVQVKERKKKNRTSQDARSNHPYQQRERKKDEEIDESIQSDADQKSKSKIGYPERSFGERSK